MRTPKLLLALAILAGCDEPTVITRVDRLDSFTADDLWTIKDGRGIPVEIHGTPFNRITDREIAELLRPMAGRSQDVTYYAAPVGSWRGGHPWRLVLHFNPQGGPNAFHDCKLIREARTNARPKNSFTVNASFCKDEGWQAHGHLEMLSIEDGDTEALGDALHTLMLEIFREEQNR